MTLAQPRPATPGKDERKRYRCVINLGGLRIKTMIDAPTLAEATHEAEVIVTLATEHRPILTSVKEIAPWQK